MANSPDILIQLGGLSYLGIFGISLIANILFVIPEEAVLLGIGYAARAGKLDIFILIPIVMLGLLISDIILYLLSRRSSKIINYFYQNYFAKKISWFSKDPAWKQDDWYRTHIEKIIFYSRFLMQLRFLGPFMAGKLNIPIRKFLTFELAALIIYVPFMLWVGWYFRSRVENLINGFGQVRNLILIGVAVIIAITVMRGILKRQIKKRV